jgi:hypothetical protein
MPLTDRRGGRAFPGLTVGESRAKVLSCPLSPFTLLAMLFAMVSTRAHDPTALTRAHPKSFEMSPGTPREVESRRCWRTSALSFTEGKAWRAETGSSPLAAPVAFRRSTAC